jgi:hypothetical protein
LELSGLSNPVNVSLISALPGLAWVKGRLSAIDLTPLQDAPNIRTLELSEAHGVASLSMFREKKIGGIGASGTLPATPHEPQRPSHQSVRLVP